MLSFGSAAFFCCRFNFGSDVEKLPQRFKWTTAGKDSCWQSHARFFANTIKLIDFERNVRSVCANPTGFSGFFIWTDRLERPESYCYGNSCTQHRKTLLKTRKNAFRSMSKWVSDPVARQISFHGDFQSRLLGRLREWKRNPIIQLISSDSEVLAGWARENCFSLSIRVEWDEREGETLDKKLFKLFDILLWSPLTRQTLSI